MKRCLARFRSDCSGNFALITSLVMVPLVLSSAVALDYSTITLRKTELQNQLDGAALAIAREGERTTQSQAYEIARTFLRQGANGESIEFQVVKNGASFTVLGTAKAGMAFAGLIGYDDYAVKAAATAEVAQLSYEIGLILDTTGSMAGGKLAAMKDAVIGMVDTMSEGAADKSRLKFAVVPFAGFVNVGPQFGPSFDEDGKQIANTGAGWLDLEGASKVEQVELVKGASRFQLYNNLGQTWPGCVETRSVAGTDYDVSDAPGNPSDPDTLFVPAFGIDEPEGSQYANSYIVSLAKPKDKTAKGKKKKLAKYGVATDAAGNPLLGGLLSDVGDLLGLGDDDDDDDDKGKGKSKGKKAKIKIDTSRSSLFDNPKGPGLGCEVEPIAPLSSDYRGIKEKVNSLKASGYTNILEGVAWGWRVLSPGAPFSEGATKKTPNLEKIMVVLTDGTNVFGDARNDLGSSYTSFGYRIDNRLGSGIGPGTATTDAMNARTLAACENAKADGTTIYTIRLEEPNVATGTMLQQCATTPDMYFDVPSRTQLDAVFGKIRDRIVKVRLAS